MKITTKEVRGTVKIIDDIIKEYKEKTPEKKRDWRTYEQRFAERLKKAFKELKPFVHKAVESMECISGETRGSKQVLTLEQKVLALLLKHLIAKSNRNMSAMLVIFSWLTDISVSYKTIERLYSDEQVVLALHNLHVLILNKRGIKQADCGGDGTGYALTVKKHYATEAQKLKDKIKKNDKRRKKKQFVFSFFIMDIKSRMYIGYGTSFKSEKKAFLEAVNIAKDTSIIISSLRLDRYFSAQMYVEFCHNNFGKIKMYLIPKKNATIRGNWEWKRMLHNFVNDTKEYLKEYYQRNQSESGISEDKKRIGWKLGQKREDRISTANICTALWHNLYWLS